MRGFKKLLRIAERHTAVPTQTRKAPPRTPGVFESIDGGTLGNVIGGRTVATGNTDPKLLQGLQGLAQGVEATGKALAGKSSQELQQSMQMMDFMQRKAGGGDRGGSDPNRRG